MVCWGIVGVGNHTLEGAGRTEKALLDNVFAVDTQVTKRTSTLGRSKGRAFHFKSGICGFTVATSRSREKASVLD